MKTIQLKINNQILDFANIGELAVYIVQELAKDNIENVLDIKYNNVPSKRFKSSKELFKEANI